ncbi:rhomboid family intramembrane serine protease [Bartonella vinsonii]|uniref:rhomboid family intramembrane serine protease n=1 Tax=Bartonella vinsonii TaxID=33047 RepID=UPI0002B6DD76|nr:rhomboid family intramembrane serine protease [Bartonella vinsonii]AGF75670.1 putative membrane protein, rhomboid family [Bartonella vinsonii subsp. berkhoffii str. Winnie]
MKNIDHQFRNASFLPKKTREPLLNVPFTIVVLIALSFCIYFVHQYFFSEQLYIKSLGFFSFTPVLFKAEPLTFFHTVMSYSFMHGSVKHVTLNMAWLLIFGTPLIRQFGGIRFFIFWALTAVIAALTYFVFHQESVIPLVGASGVVSGMMGAIARYGFSLGYWGKNTHNERLLGSLLSLKHALCSKGVLVYVSIWLGIDFIIGISSFLFEGDGISIAWEAHIGGFFAGFLLIGFFDISSKKCNTTI